MKTNTQPQTLQLVPDKLKDIELKLSDKPTGGKYVRHAYIHNRYVGTVIGSNHFYFIHFHNTIKRTAIWADVGVMLHNNYNNCYASCSKPPTPKPTEVVVQPMVVELDGTGI